MFGFYPAPRRLLAAVAMLLFTAGCAGGGDTPTTPGGVTPPIAPAPVPPGILILSATGLPEGAVSDVQVQGPLPGSSFSRAASGPVTWTDIPSGRHTITVRSVRTPLGLFGGAPASFDVDVPAGGPPTSAVAAYRPLPSHLAVTVSGLPTGVDAAILVTPPGGAATAVAQSTTLTAAQLSTAATTPDQWRLTAQPVVTGGSRYAPSRSSLDTTVSYGDTARVALPYSVATGAIAVAVTGLPTGVAASVRIFGPDTVTRVAPVTTTFTGLEPGRYRVVSSAVTHTGVVYRPTADTLTIDVIASLTAAPAPVAYAAQVGSLALTVTGLPTDAAGALTLSGNGISRALTTTGTTDSLPDGTYTLSASAVVVSGDRFAPTPATQTVRISTGASVPAGVQYTLASGSLALTLIGLPNGLAGDVVVTGPGNYTRTLTTSQTVSGLEPGRYTITPRVVRNATDAYGVLQGVRVVDVVAGSIPSALSLTYVLVPTVVDVPVTGLPGGANANIVVTGPAGETYNVTASQRILPAAPGRWRLSAGAVSAGGANYLPTPTTRDMTVAAGDTLAFGVQYQINTGSLAVAIIGLPTGASGAVTVTGPNGYVRALTSTTTITLLTPGSYTVSASAVTTAGSSYQPSPTVQTVAVSASTVASPATVSYALPTGSLTVTTSGLPGGAVPTFTLSGPGPAQSLNGAGTVSSLTVGNWSVAAANVVVAGTTYTPSPALQLAAIGANSTTSVSFAYSPSGGGGGGGGALNYSIAAVYLTQAIQKIDGSVPLVANRDALLRVFVVATGANSARPDVRVRLYDGATLLQTTTVTAPETSVRTSLAEGTLSSTWNVLVAAGNVRPALRVLVDLDPAQAIPDATRTDNTWPSSGTPQAITVNSVPTFNVRFVPVVVGALTGNVSNGNTASYLASALRTMPLQQIAADVRAPFTSSATVLEANDGNGQWLTVLNEINALRATDGAPNTTHYYGVVKVGYTSGIAGYGYVPGRAAIGWDHLPSGSGVAAHEWGHNFSRSHAPCGVSGDSNYPYAGGAIGGFGWNSSSNTIVTSTATDFMGYCSNTWVSDYTWSGVMAYRSGSGFTTAANVIGSRGDGLLVWGRVVNGQVLLEPAFRVDAPYTPSAPTATHRVDLLDATGATLAQLPIEASVVDHAANQSERQFAVVLPWSAALESRLNAVRVSDVRVPLRAALRQSRETATLTPADVDLSAQIDRDVGRVRVSWRNASYSMAMVRDAATGQVMGFVRRPGTYVATGGRNVDVVFSDGVRSLVRR